MIKKRLTLEQAKAAARAQNVPLHRDYHALSGSDKDALDAIMQRTAWKQSASSRARGNSRRYAFFLALDRA